ncbi:MAG: hypothetical protein M3301_08195, partial [Chloroflexota bacterium]|nr:hypothetical protein [Chloroflexota bacterium]
MTGHPQCRPRAALLSATALAALSLLVALTVGGSPAHAAFPGLNGRIACDGDRGPVANPLPAPTNYSLSEVYSMNPDGSDLKLLTNNVGVRDLDPAWSPDGRKISFDSREVGAGTASEVFTMNADGSDPKRITFAASSDDRTAWAPDGMNIAFMTGRDGNSNIYRIASDGSDTLGTRLTTDASGDFSPAWSPDGTTIGFDSSQPGQNPTPGRGGDTNSEIYT